MNINNILIAKNASILLITDIISKILQTVLSIIIARKLGASDFGLLGYAISFSMIFSFIPNFGFLMFINREVAKYPEKSGIYFSNIAIIKLILSVFTFFIIFISSYIIQMENKQFTIVCIAALIMLIDSFILFYTAFFKGFQKAEYEALILISENFLVAVTGIIVVSLGYSLLCMMIIRLLVIFSIFILGLFILKIKFLQPPFTIKLSSSFDLLKSAKAFTILSILIVFNAHFGIVLLTNMKGTLYTGWYLASLKLCGIFQFIPASVTGAILPAMTKFAKENNKSSLEITFNKSLKYLLMIVLPIAAGTTLLADRIILLIYKNNDFINSIFTLKILIWIIVLSFSNNIFYVAFSSINKERKFVYIQILGTLINISICLLLIPVLAHNGIAIATVLAELIVFILALLIISKYYIDFKIFATNYKLILATIIMTLIILLISSYNIFIIIFIAIITYFLSIFILKSFDYNEINTIKLISNKVLILIKRLN